MGPSTSAGGAGPVDTVYLGAFRRSALERVGGYDERYTRTQDWHLNLRIRQTGGTVWFTPDMKVTYRPRSSVRALARQYFQYGHWRRVVIREHPETVERPLPRAAGHGGRRRRRRPAVGMAWAPALLVPAAYAAGVGVGGLAISRGEALRTRLLTPVALATMHWSWGAGFLTSRATSRRPPRSRVSADPCDTLSRLVGSRTEECAVGG